MATTVKTATAHKKKPLTKQLYFWVLVAIILGILVGHFFPTVGASLEPVGTSFVNLIKMVIAPVIFCTVVTGIASMKDMKTVGRVGVRLSSTSRS
jgi:aerobic C4-dicarboxylate transport protein